MTVTKNKNTILLLTLSSAFEYYDFIIYGLMASYLGVLFFPSENELVSQLQVFAVFALSYVVRPLGGIILGMLGDLTSRRNIFIRSNLILALATLIISIIPTYSQIGVAATIILIILRIIQAFTFASELPGSMSLIKDGMNIPSQNFSFIISGAALGSILASSTLYLLESIFSRAEILEYGWRIAFFIGALLCLVSMLMRRNLPQFKQDRAKDKFNLFAIIAPQHKNIITFVCIISLAAYLIIMNIFFPSFLPQFYEFQLKEVYLAISISLFWSVIFAPCFAYLTKAIAKITILRIIIALSIILSLVINFLLLRHSMLYLVLGLCLYQSIISSLMVIIFPLMAEIFPSQARFTLIATCYNIAYLIMSFAPMLVTKLATSWASPLPLWLGFILLSLFTLANMNTLDEEEYYE